MAAALAAMAVSAAPAQAFEDAWVVNRSAGSETQTMTYVQYLATEPDGTVYLSDANNGGSTFWSRIRVFDSNLEGSSSIGTYGSGSGELRAVRGIDVDDDGNFYVTQASGNGVAVKKLSPSGTQLDTMGTLTSSSNPAPGQFFIPGDIAVDDDTGAVYVADTTDWITKFDANGDYVTRFGGPGTGPGQSNQVYGIAVAPDGNVHVVDWDMDFPDAAGDPYVRNTAIHEFQPDGTFVGSWGHDDEDREADLSWTEDLVFDENGFAYVTDSYAFVGAGEEPQDVVKVFDPDKELVYRFGRYTETGEDDAWLLPGGIGLDDSGGVYVADGGNKRVVKWQLNASPPDLTSTEPSSPSTSTTALVLGNADPGASVELFDNAECTGTPVAGGSEEDLAEGLEVTVEPDSTNTFWARATSSNGGESTCSEESITYTNQTATPEAPVMSGTVPGSPANDNNPFVKGTAPDESTVEIYTNATCTGAPAASGPSAEFADTGIQVTVADNSTTTFYGKTTNAAGSSGCSDSSVTYVEDSTVPPPPKCPDGQTGTPPDCKTPPPSAAQLSLGKVKVVKLKAGKKRRVSVPVTNTGGSAATGVKVCARVNPKKKRRTVKVGKCAEFSSIGAGAQAVARFTVRATKKAKGKAKLRISVSSGNAGSPNANVGVRVLPAKKKKKRG